MRVNNIYRHKRTLDIDVECLKVQYVGPKYIKVKLKIFNRHNGIFYETGTYKIMKDDLKNWELVK